MRWTALAVPLLLSAAVPVPAAAQVPDVACTRPVEVPGPAVVPADFHRIARGEGVRVAVIDTGVADHPELRVEPVADLVSPGTPDPFLDCDGHGTIVAGVVQGVAPDAQILSIRQSSAHHRQVDGGPAGTLASLADAVHRALDAGARVVNISVVSCLDPAVLLDTRPLHEALHRAEEEGAVVVAAAGNSGAACRPGMVVYPSHEDTVLSVAAVHPGDPHAVADYVMPGAEHVSAPGRVEVGMSPAGHGWASGMLQADGRETGFEGTSFAAPVVSGVAALLRERHPEDSAAQIRDRIRQAAEPGNGVVDPRGTLTHLSGTYTVAGRGIAAGQEETTDNPASARSTVILSGAAVALLLGVLTGSARRGSRTG